MREKRERIAISIDPAILRRIDERAEQEGRSRSNYIEIVMRREMGLKLSRPYIK